MPLQTNKGTLYLLDGYNNELFIGDYVKCLTHNYQAIAKGDRRRIQGFDGENIVLNNHMSPEGVARYSPTNFIIAARHHPEHKRYDHMEPEPKFLPLYAELYPVPPTFKENNQMAAATLQAAILIPAGMNKDEFFNFILEGKNKKQDDFTTLYAPTPHQLKAAIEEDICENPFHRWFHINTQQISETAAPPIRTRVW